MDKIYKEFKKFYKHPEKYKKNGRNIDCIIYIKCEDISKEKLPKLIKPVTHFLLYNNEIFCYSVMYNLIEFGCNKNLIIICFRKFSELEEYRFFINL